MIDREHGLPIVRQADTLNISRGSVYYLPRPVPDADLDADIGHRSFPVAA
jgi:putative transposase